MVRLLLSLHIGDAGPSQVREHDVSVRCVYAEVYAKAYAPVCLKRRQKLPEK